jgi:uncharacterized protein YcbX
MPILTELNLYPIKSCAGIPLQRATLSACGLMSEYVYDRQWMVVDLSGNFLTQREIPKMACITPRLVGDKLEVSAPGMAKLALPLGLSNAALSPTVQVSVWDDQLLAFDCGQAAGDWFSQVLGVSCRLVRAHPGKKRLINNEWTDGRDIPTHFADGYPMLVISEASLADLNHKLLAQARPALPMNRFRPNLVIAGVDAFEEDYAETIKIGEATLQPIKPCARCTIPSVDQATGLSGLDPLDILQSYRANPKLDGAISFGMNVILLEGEGHVLEVGQEVTIELAF